MSPTPADATAERAGGAAPYQRHRPEHTLLCQIVEQYYPAFAALMAGQECPLPDYVQREFEDYLRCGRQSWARCQASPIEPSPAT